MESCRFRSQGPDEGSASDSRPLLSSKTTRNRIIQAGVVRTLSDYHRSLRTGADGPLSSVILERQLVKDQDY